LKGDTNGGRGTIGQSDLTADVPEIRENADPGEKEDDNEANVLKDDEMQDYDLMKDFE